MKLNKKQATLLAELLRYSDRYEITLQFWPDMIAVYIAKGFVDLVDFGGDFDSTIGSSVDYLNRINKTK